MQTFLPYADFDLSAAVLDDVRLKKQRVECKQIYQAHTVPGYGWQFHPAVNMWRGHDFALLEYAMSIHRECDWRGIRDNVNIVGFFLINMAKCEDTGPPFWFGDERLHLSHQSKLKRKFPTYYRQFNVPADLPYYWPV